MKMQEKAEELLEFMSALEDSRWRFKRRRLQGEQATTMALFTEA